MTRAALLALAAATILAACGGGGGSRPGSGDIEATRLAPIEGRGACGISRPYAVYEVAGVRLSRPATITMETARALDAWVTNVAIPEVGRRGGGLRELTVAASYACRTRNSRRGARISEHAKGNAIDISAIVMRDGSRVTVLNGWNDPDDARLLRRLHRGACGPFGTVLGPNSDRFHQDHFHFDVARYRNGPYCR